jgi:hypothetical protein
MTGISNFTRDICRMLCIERAVDMEIARLDDKLKIMRERPLTESETRWDKERHEDSVRMFEGGHQCL